VGYPISSELFVSVKINAGENTSKCTSTVIESINVEK
jgi:hypothetical protein